MLCLERLAKRYGDVVALDGCTLSVPRGSMLGFLGPNGAGKTTAMRSVFGLVDLDEGEVTWDGAPIGRTERFRFGYMPEERGLYPRMTVLDQVTYFARHHGLERSEAHARSVDLLDELGLGDRHGARIQNLSHGNQQRVQLAVALVPDPDLLVLDEPFSGLDPVGAESLVEVLRRRTADGVAVLFSSHQLDVVEHLCQDVVIIDDGAVVLQGGLDDLRAASTRRCVDIVVEAPDLGWIADLDPAEVVQADGNRVRLDVAADRDPDFYFEIARKAGDLIEFSFSPPPLSEIFREAVTR